MWVFCFVFLQMRFPSFEMLSDAGGVKDEELFLLSNKRKVAALLLNRVLAFFPLGSSQPAAFQSIFPSIHTLQRA